MRIQWIQPPDKPGRRCFFCEEPITEGQKTDSRWDGGLVAHVECAPAPEPGEAAKADAVGREP